MVKIIKKLLLAIICCLSFITITSCKEDEKIITIYNLYKNNTKIVFGDLAITKPTTPMVNYLTNNWYKYTSNITRETSDFMQTIALDMDVEIDHNTGYNHYSYVVKAIQKIYAKKIIYEGLLLELEYELIFDGSYFYEDVKRFETSFEIVDNQKIYGDRELTYSSRDYIETNWVYSFECLPMYTMPFYCFFSTNEEIPLKDFKKYFKDDTIDNVKMKSKYGKRQAFFSLNNDILDYELNNNCLKINETKDRFKTSYQYTFNENYKYTDALVHIEGGYGENVEKDNLYGPLLNPRLSFTREFDLNNKTTDRNFFDFLQIGKTGTYIRDDELVVESLKEIQIGDGYTFISNQNSQNKIENFGLLKARYAKEDLNSHKNNLLNNLIKVNYDCPLYNLYDDFLQLFKQKYLKKRSCCNN